MGVADCLQDTARILQTALGAIPVATILWATLAWIAFGVYQDAALEIVDDFDIWPDFMIRIFRAYSITLHFCLISCVVLAVACTGYPPQDQTRVKTSVFPGGSVSNS